MRLQKTQEALDRKKIYFSYTEEDGCGSVDFEWKGLRYHIWEYFENTWGAETNLFDTGRSRDIEGDYDSILAEEILRNFGTRSL